MNVSYQWLKALAPELEGAPGELADRLASRGFPVEHIQALAEGLQDIVVARVQAVREHPDADRLRVCDVDGGDGVVQVVCGAPNVEQGGWYPFAPVGATLPQGMTIGKVELRGQASEGMLCSERELGLGKGHEGLMALDGDLEPGQPLLDALTLDDYRLDVEVTANRPDMLSHEGVAREVTPAGHGGLTLPDVPDEDRTRAKPLQQPELQVDPEEVTGDGVSIRIEAPELCSRYLGLVVRGVKVGPSPLWLQTRLRSVGARPINNVVDATNYVLLELGQPLHAFDLARVHDQSIVVRRARGGETLRTLDGEERELADEMLAICDPEGPLAVAGVMGGEESEVSEATTDVLLECALFTPGPIRATRKALGLSTDASYRFERGVDPEGMLRALLRAARIILATSAGGFSGTVLDCQPRPFSRQRIALRTERVERVLGVPFGPDRIRALLEPLGFSVEGDEDDLLVEVPGFRSYDVTREVDLIEEIARTHGYDRFPDAFRPFRPGTVPDHPLFELEDRIRDALTAWGLLEAQTPAFAPEGEGEVEIQNPVSTEEGYLRSSLVSGLARRLEHNLARGNRDVRLFELGTVFSPGAPGEPPRERTNVAAVLHGRRGPRHWSDPEAVLDLWDLKGLLQRVVELVPGETWSLRTNEEVEPDERVFDTELAIPIVDGHEEPVGIGGRLRAEALDLPPWAGDVWALEVTLPDEPEPPGDVVYQPLPIHPGVDRDLALLVPEAVPVERVLSVARARGGEELRELAVFDVFRGSGVPEGERSVAIRLHFQAQDRTLEDREVDEAVEGIVRSLQEELSVRVRGEQG